MSVMTMLLAAEAAGLGALFFGVFRGERELRQALGIPAGLELLGAIALGHPLETGDRKGDGGNDPTPRSLVGGISAGRSRRRSDEIIHPGRW
jgi:nitroreductase